MSNVAVFGVGYVGSVTAACLSRDGHRVIGVDVDAEKVAALNNGRPPVREPGLAELVCSGTVAGSLRATTDVVEAVARTDIALIAVGTPSDEEGGVSTAAVESVIVAIGRALSGTDRTYTLVLRSTLLPGILEDRLAPLLSRSAASAVGGRLRLCNNPEFLREGSAICDYDDPPFVLVGAQDTAHAEPILALYAGIAAENIVTDTRTAALVKYGCNAFHALKVSFANEMGALAKSFGGDGHRVMQLLCKDTKLNVSPAYLRPGFAFGGSCLPKDLRALTRHAERDAIRLPLVGSILPSNEEQIRRALKVIERIGVRKIGLVGLSFKAGTDDLRESPQVVLAEALLGKGYDVRIYDPGIRPADLRGRNLAYVDRHLPHLAALLVSGPQEMFDHAELLVLCTDIASQLLDSVQGRLGCRVFDLCRDLASGRFDGMTNGTVTEQAESLATPGAGSIAPRASMMKSPTRLL